MPSGQRSLQGDGNFISFPEESSRPCNGSSHDCVSYFAGAEKACLPRYRMGVDTGKKSFKAAEGDNKKGQDGKNILQSHTSAYSEHVKDFL